MEQVEKSEASVTKWWNIHEHAYIIYRISLSQLYGLIACFHPCCLFPTNYTNCTIGEKFRNLMELYNVMELHVFQKELLILSSKPSIPPQPRQDNKLYWRNVELNWSRIDARLICYWNGNHRTFANLLHSMTSDLFGKLCGTYGILWNFYGTLHSGNISGIVCYNLFCFVFVPNLTVSDWRLSCCVMSLLALQHLGLHINWNTVFHFQPIYAPVVSV